MKALLILMLIYILPSYKKANHKFTNIYELFNTESNISLFFKKLLGFSCTHYIFNDPILKINGLSRLYLNTKFND